MRTTSPFIHKIWVLRIVLLGFSSGLPFLLTLSTLSVRLTESGVSNTILGLFTVATLPYTFKFILSPFVDQCCLPFLTKYFGKRRAWGLLSQVCLFFALMGLGATNPHNQLWLTALMVLVVCFFAAIQDIVLEAYRIETTDENSQGTAATATYLGFRLGMMASGAGALYLASFFPWVEVYTVMACCLSVGILTLLLSPEPRTSFMHPVMSTTTSSWKSFWLFLIKGLDDLIQRHDLRIIVAFILFYKVGDTVLNVMNMPFLVQLGFSKVEIAEIAKFFGITAMIFGGLFGSVILNQFGVPTGLIFCAGLQIISCLMFFIQALVGHNLVVLTVVIGVENFTCGLGASAFIAYISGLCSLEYTAVHYAILSSVGSCARILISSLAGWLADQMSWTSFFLLSGLFCCPSMILLLVAFTHFKEQAKFFSVPIRKVA